MHNTAVTVVGFLTQIVTDKVGVAMYFYRSFVTLAALLFVVDNYCAAQEKGVLTPADLSEVEKVRSERRDLIDPSKQYCDTLGKLSISYDVEYQVLQRQPSRHHVHSSANAILVEASGEFAFAWSDENGGFFVGKLPDATEFSVQNLLPADQMAKEPNSRYEFEAKANMSFRGLHLFGGYGGGSITHVNSLLLSPWLVIKNRQQTKDGLLTINYTQKSVPSIPGSGAGSGSLTVDPSAFCLIREQKTKLGAGPVAVTSTETRTYHPPTSEIPYPLLKEHVRVDNFAGAAKGPTQIKLTFSNYKLEPVPAEKLKLSYWIKSPSVPDALIAAPKRSYWPYYVVAGVVALLGAGFWLARRRQRRLTG